MTSVETKAPARFNNPPTIEEKTEMSKCLCGDPSAFPPLEIPGFAKTFFFERGHGLLGSDDTMTVMLDKDTVYADGVGVKESYDKGGKTVLILRDGDGNEIAKCVQAEGDKTYAILGKEALTEGDQEVEPGFYPWYRYTNDVREDKLMHKDLEVWNGEDYVASVPDVDGNDYFVKGFYPARSHLNLANHGKEQLVFAMKSKVDVVGDKKKTKGKEIKMWEVSMAPAADVALIICLAAIMQVSNP